MVSLTQSIQTLFRELAAYAEGGRSTPVPEYARQNCFNWHLAYEKIKEDDQFIAKDISELTFSSPDNPWKVFTVIGKRPSYLFMLTSLSRI